MRHHEEMGVDVKVFQSHVPLSGVIPLVLLSVGLMSNAFTRTPGKQSVCFMYLMSHVGSLKDRVCLSPNLPALLSSQHGSCGKEFRSGALGQVLTPETFIRT